MILLLDERQRKELAQYSPYIAMLKVSSQNRRYIPMDYLEREIIPGDKLFTMPSATSYEFGKLMSNVHMAWTRAVCGRLKSDYSYSNTIVYNNFPWPSPTKATLSATCRLPVHEYFQVSGVSKSRLTDNIEKRIIIIRGGISHTNACVGGVDNGSNERLCCPSG